MRMAPIHPDNPGKPIVKVKRRHTMELVPTTTPITLNTPMKSPNKTMKVPSTSTRKSVRQIKSPLDTNKITAKVKKELLTPTTSKSKLMTPNKVVPQTSSQTDKKQSWRSRLTPAHSGVPLPEKLTPTVKVKRRHTMEVPTTQIEATNTPMKSPNKTMIVPSTSTRKNVRQIKSPLDTNKITAKVKKELLTPTSKSKLMTPNKVVPQTSSQTDKKKSWRSRLTPAHSGVPLPEKFRKMAKFFRDLKDLF